MATLQKIGKSFMLPIALLPAAGILLGIGGSFTNQAMVQAYGLTFLAEGTPLNALLVILRDAGDIIFGNLPVLFAMGVAVGMSKKEKGAAAIAAFIGFIVMNKTVANINNLGYIEAIYGVLPNGSTATVLGIENTLQMGVFGGIISGLVTVWLHNKYIDAQLPEVLGFFGGPRLIPILAMFSAIVLGFLLAFTWPMVGAYIINPISGAVQAMGPFWGSFVFGVVERALIPFGLHHIFYLPLWQTAVGGTYQICGTEFYGTQNAFFGALACPTGITDGINQFAEQTNGLNFMSGKFPFMIFGLPGAALAMYHTALPKNKKVVGALMIGAAGTAMLTGITEPIEFTFLFVAPMLYYGFHVFMAGLSFALCAVLNVNVGMTFSGGIIDLTLFGILPSLMGAATNWLWIVAIGVPYFFIYYFVFRFAIIKWDLATPGRRDDEEAELMTKAKYNEIKSGNNAGNEISELAEKLIVAFGGDDNIVSVDACITRVRVEVKDAALVAPLDDFKALGAAGLVVKGKAVQAIYGAKAVHLKTAINEILGLDD